MAGLRFPLTLVALFLAASFAGCIADAPVPLTPEPEPRPMAAPENLFDEWASFEATVAVAPDGTVYATSALGVPFLAKRPDGTIEHLKRPVPLVAPFLGAQPTDVMIQTDSAGRLYFHALLYHVENNPAYYAFMLVGLYVAVSEDGGKTWPVNTYIGLPQSEQAPQLGADRQWLSIAPDGTLYIVYQRIPPILSPRAGPVPLNQLYMLADRGVMFSRSDDGGHSWSTFRKISAPTGVINGQPIVHDDGRLFVPFFEYGSERALKVAASDDRGDTFTTHAVYTHEEPGDWFPSLVFLDDARLAMTWVGTGSALFLATSDDGGSTWTAPIAWTASNRTVATSPWTLVANGTLHVLWFQDEGEETASLWWTTAPVDDLTAPTHRVIDPLINGTTSKRAMTDFAHGVLADGHLHTVWTDLQDTKLWHLTQPLP